MQCTFKPNTGTTRIGLYWVTLDKVKPIAETKYFHTETVVHLASKNFKQKFDFNGSLQRKKFDLAYAYFWSPNYREVDEWFREPSNISLTNEKVNGAHQIV